MVVSRESSKIFVAKIPVYVSQEDLHAAFLKFGMIEETKMLFHEDGTFRGCAFIKYTKDESACKALTLNNASVFGKENLIVRMAEDKRTNQKKKQDALDRRAKSLNATHSWLHGLDQKTGWDNTWNPRIYAPCDGFDYISDYQRYGHPAPIWTEYYTPDGVAYFHNSLTGLTQWERPLDLSEHGETPLFTDAQFTNGGSHQASTQGNGKLEVENSEQGGYMLETDSDGGRHGPAGCNLFVFHLPDEWADADLYNDFSPFGNIVSAKVMKETSTQRSRGFGFVSYDCRKSALLAIKKMQGFKAGKKRLKVDFKKGESPSPIFDFPISGSKALETYGNEMFQVQTRTERTSAAVQYGYHDVHDYFSSHPHSEIATNVPHLAR